METTSKRFNGLAVKILSALKERRGFDDWWDSVRSEDRYEIVDEVAALIAGDEDVAAVPDLVAALKTAEQTLIHYATKGPGGGAAAVAANTVRAALKKAGVLS